MNEVIAAVATARGEGAIAVIRLSGPGSVALVDGLFVGRRPLAEEPARRMALGTVVDQVLAVRFESGASYTGEESVEIHCHGGSAAVQRSMELLVASGARLALPGEFTKRAFLSGRIDLAQAEAVLCVIRAKSDAALVSANRSLQGELSARLSSLMGLLTTLRAALEVRLDYPEEVDDDEAQALASDLSGVRAATGELIDRCRVGVMLQNGLAVAIVGRPNVGKSSLLNALVGEDRAIVTDIPGTTRDTIDASTVHRGVALRFVDTAGIRAPGNAIEGIGIERSFRAMYGADLCLMVADSSHPPTDEDLEIWRRATELSGKPGKPLLFVLNKSDLGQAMTAEDIADVCGLEMGAVPSVFVSTVTGEGVLSLKDAIVRLALGRVSLEGSYAATERMVEALRCAAVCMDEAMEAIARSAGVDVAGSLLAEASLHLAEPLGADASEDLLDAIFSGFCVGK